jgi:hypothetical protein
MLAGCDVLHSNGDRVCVSGTSTVLPLSLSSFLFPLSSFLFPLSSFLFPLSQPLVLLVRVFLAFDLVLVPHPQHHDYQNSITSG